MKLFHENPIFETVKSKVIISLFETVRLSVSISPRNLYNSLKSIKEKSFCKAATGSLMGHYKPKIRSLAPRLFNFFFMLNSIKHEILNVPKYKNIKKFSIFQAHISIECFFFFAHQC